MNPKFLTILLLRKQFVEQNSDEFGVAKRDIERAKKEL